MESRVKLLGHPVHPMLIVSPWDCWRRPLPYDIVGLASGDAEWFGISSWMIAAGIIGGLLSAVFGLVDWLAIPSGTRAKRIGLWPGGGNVIVTVLFIISRFLRRPAPENPVSAFVLSFIAVALALVTLGGELVDRLGVGVDNGAHLNAPSSLSGRLATDRDSRVRRTA